MKEISLKRDMVWLPAPVDQEIFNCSALSWSMEISDIKPQSNKRTRLYVQNVLYLDFTIVQIVRG
jgi:hypothetical protein